MNLDEKVNHDKVEEYRKLRSKYGNLASLFGFIGIVVALSTLFVVKYSIGAPLVTIILALFTGGLMVEFGGKSEHYGELVRNERDKVYNLNYSNIKNIIVNDGDENMKQLATWERMCELTASDKEKYAELLRIVHDVCWDYTRIWR